MDLKKYIDKIIEPTFEEYRRNQLSPRHAIICCMVVYHAIDYASYPNKTKSLHRVWCTECRLFNFVDVVANHFKHVRSMSEKDADRGIDYGGLPLHFAILRGNDENDQLGIDLHNLYQCVFESVVYIKKWCENNH